MLWEREGCCDSDLIFDLVAYVFAAGSVACLLMGVHRIASALKLGARAEAYEAVEDSLSPEEREVLVSKIAAHAARYM